MTGRVMSGVIVAEVLIPGRQKMRSCPLCSRSLISIAFDCLFLMVWLLTKPAAVELPVCMEVGG